MTTISADYRTADQALQAALDAASDDVRYTLTTTGALAVSSALVSLPALKDLAAPVEFDRALSLWVPTR